MRAYARVRYAGVYDGIDLVYYGNQQRLEYDFEVAPGRDPNAIRLRFDGASRVEIDEATGDLLLHCRGRSGRREAAAPAQADHLSARSTASAVTWRAATSFIPISTVGFVVGAYDRTAPLTIDPILLYSTFFGGNSEETIYDIALDPAGNIYVTGRTQDNTGFPTTPGAFQTTKPGNTDAFVSKFNPQGSALIYSTFLGGTWTRTIATSAADASPSTPPATPTSPARPTPPTSRSPATRHDPTYAAALANPPTAST